LDKVEFCDHCILGKQHRVKFGSGMHYSSKPFEYVHSDLWGPSKTLTHGESSYFLSIINDYSRRACVFDMKNKSNTFEKFKECHTLIENQMGIKFKGLRSGNGM